MPDKKFDLEDRLVDFAGNIVLLVSKYYDLQAVLLLILERHRGQTRIEII